MLEKLKEEVLVGDLELVNSGLVLFTWGNVSGEDPEMAIHNALVEEQVAKMAYFTKQINNDAKMNRELLDKHYIKPFLSAINSQIN